MEGRKRKETKSNDRNDRAELIKYFSEICDGEINYAATQSILNRMMKDDFQKYTYNGLKYALWYIHNKKQIKVTSIQFASFYYEEAQKYYNWLNRIKQQISTWQMNDDVDVVVKKEKEEDIFK